MFTHDSKCSNRPEKAIPFALADLNGKERLLIMPLIKKAFNHKEGKS